MYLYLIPCYYIFLQNTSNYSCFVAVCHLLFFPVGIACVIFNFLLLYYVTSLLHLYLRRRNGTNFRQTMPEKVDNPLYPLSPFFAVVFFPPSPSCSVHQNHGQLAGVTCFVGRALSCGTDSFSAWSTYLFPKNLVLDTFGAHHCIPYVFPTLSLLRQRYF